MKIILNKKTMEFYDDKNIAYKINMRLIGFKNMFKVIFFCKILKKHPMGIIKGDSAYCTFCKKVSRYYKK